jgi:PAS domain S-box-containing protein
MHEEAVERARIPNADHREAHAVMASTADPESRQLGHGTQWAIAAVLAGLLVMLVVAGYFFNQIIKLEEAQSLAESEAIARSVAASVQAREEGYLNNLQAYAGRFRFREAVERRDRVEALVHLRQLREFFPEMDAAFLADPAGVLWARFPEAPEIYGRSFADRDWYRGVSREWRPHVSDVFLSAATEEPTIVLVVPIRGLNGEVIGIIGSGQRLTVIRQWLLPIKVPGGGLYIVDRKGQFVFHPTRLGPEHLSDYAGVPTVGHLLRGQDGVIEGENPVEKDVQLTAYRQLPSLGWGLAVYRSRNVAVRRMHTLILASGAVGLVLTLALVLLGAVVLRSQRRLAAAFAERTRASDSLLEANAFLDSVLENIPNMVFVKDAKELRFVRHNKAGEQLLGYSREQLLGKNDYDFSPAPEAESFTSRDREVLEGREVLDIPEEPVQTAHQGIRILHTKKIPILDEEGRPRYLLGISEDITERKEADEALRDAKQEAEQANQAKSEFLSRMSHELRTPLNAVLGFAQLLEIEALTVEQRESVEHILKGGRHLLGLIDEVLDISRIEAGHLSISLEPVLLTDVIGEALDLIHPLAARWNVLIEGRPPKSDDVYVLADRQRLKQVLLNFLSNAAKYNRHEGTVSVSVKDAPGDRLRVNVTDTGPGIPPEKMGRLFTPFDRLGAEERAVEGTGLGLALSKRLVEVMGGAIGAESAVGEGSTFWVELPRAEDPAAEINLPAAALAQSHAAVGAVLYIEDNLSNLRLVERVLERRPEVKLLSAMQGGMGLELAREHRPGLILLDLQLPDIPGVEVLKRLQHDPRTRQIPVVVISADATPGQIKRLRSYGAREFLTKPLDVKRLLVLLDEVLNEGEG